MMASQVHGACLNFCRAFGGLRPRGRAFQRTLHFDIGAIEEDARRNEATFSLLYVHYLDILGGLENQSVPQSLRFRRFVQKTPPAGS